MNKAAGWVERVLNHRLQGVMATYNQAEYEDERIECAKIVDTVIQDIVGNWNREKENHTAQHRLGSSRHDELDDVGGVALKYTFVVRSSVYKPT